MNHRYQPQATDISTKLYWTFFFGIVLGTALGYGLRGAREERVAPPVDVAEVTSVAPSEAVETDTPPVPAEPAHAVEPDPTPVEPVAVPTGPFNPDVKGMWPARHVIAGVKGTMASVETLEWLNTYKPGGVLLGPENIEDPLQLGALVLQIKNAVGLGTTISDPPIIYYQDETQPLPKIAAILEMADGDTASTVTEQARAARANGIGVFLAPPLDIYVPGVSAESLKMTALGSQPGDVTRAGLDFARQIKAGGVLPVASHFPGAGLAVRRADGLWQIPGEQMDGLIAGMQPFQDAIATGIPGLLVGHMAVPGIDPDNPERAASRSPKLLQILLREKFGYTGVVLSDDLGRDPQLGELPLERLAVTALVNGCDAVIVKEADGDKLQEICGALVRLAERRDFPTAQLAASRKRLDDWQVQLGKAPAPTAAPEEKAPVTVVAENTDEATPAATSPDDGNVEAAPADMAIPAPDENAETKVDVAKPTEDTPPVEAASNPVVDEKKPMPAEEKKSEEIVVASDTPMVETVVTLPKASTDPKAAKTEEKKAMPEVVVIEAPKTDEKAEEKKANPEKEPVAEVKVAEDAGNDEAPTGEFLEHKIEKGDSLNLLAKRYGVSVDDLMKWNNLNDQTIKYGYKLKIKQASGSDTPDTAAKATEEEKPVAVADAKKETPASTETMAPVEEAIELEAIDGSAASEEPATPSALKGSEPTEAPAAPEKSPTPQPKNTDKRSHTVAAGDTVASIADTFGVSSEDVVAWNGLKDSKTPPEAGGTLVVYLPMAAADEKEDGDDDASSDTETYEIHVVSSGDNLRRIAQKYGVTQAALMELNKIKEPDHVQLGWKLKIPKK